jgi:hypothetical protein
MFDLAGRPELVVRKLAVKGADHPTREAGPNKSEDGGKCLLGGETAPRHCMQMRPVDDWSDKLILRCELGDITETSKGFLVAGRL